MFYHYESAFLKVSALLSLINMLTVLLLLNGGNCEKIKTDYSVLKVVYHIDLNLVCNSNNW